MSSVGATQLAQSRHEINPVIKSPHSRTELKSGTIIQTGFKVLSSSALKTPQVHSAPVLLHPPPHPPLIFCPNVGKILFVELFLVVQQVAANVTTELEGILDCCSKQQHLNILRSLQIKKKRKTQRALACCGGRCHKSL